MKRHRIYRVFGTISDYDSHDEWTVAYCLERSRADELRATLERELDEAIAWCEEWARQNPEPKPTVQDILSWQRENNQAIPPDDISEWQDKRTAHVGERLSHMLCAQRGGLHPNSINGRVRVGRSWTATYTVETMLDDPTARCSCKDPRSSNVSVGYDLSTSATLDPACPFHGDE